MEKLVKNAAPLLEDKVETSWKSFEQTGSIQDYLSYISSLGSISKFRPLNSPSDQ